MKEGGRAWAVLLENRQAVACPQLTVTVEGRGTTMIGSPAEGGRLHPVHQAFIDLNGYQCADQRQGLRGRDDR